jgi:hypothetical protein
MPRYVFHIDGRRPHRDATGEVCKNDHDAWACALRLLRDVESGYIPGDSWRVEVCRETTSIYVLLLASRAVEARPAPD